MLLDIRNIRPGSLVKLYPNYDCIFSTITGERLRLTENSIYMFLGYTLYPLMDKRVNLVWAVDAMRDLKNEWKNLLFIKLLVDSRTKEIYLTHVPAINGSQTGLPEDFFDGNYLTSMFVVVRESGSD